MIALIVISTGPRYWPYINPLLDSAAKYLLPHYTFLFTDDPDLHPCEQVPVTAQGYPNETLHRYHTILEHEHVFDEYSHLFYIDVDALFVSPTGEEILSDGITATLHAGYVTPSRFNQFRRGDWETRPASLAYVPPDTGKTYYCGGFNGGTREAYLEMARIIRGNINIDAKRDIVAKWHDESHLNRYLAYKPPAKVLSPAYCYPEPQRFCRPDPMDVLRLIEAQRTAGMSEKDIWNQESFSPKIVCLEKRWR